MTYEQQIENLFSRIPSYQVVGARAYKPGIETMIAFDEALGHPHKHYKVIHIAGTNGKGSVSSMMAAALSAKGFKVALYTSPHLVDFRERIKVVTGGGFEMITKEAVSSFLTRFDTFIETSQPSFFEITTAMAFSWFSEQNVDYAVIETGLGGRLDSTNVVNPVISIITNIGLEHCFHLGYTLREIAGEKAGIIKKGVPVVVGQTVRETLPVFEQKAYECESKLILSQHYDISAWPVNADECDLKGDYQSENLKAVIAALDCLGLKPDRSVAEAIEHCAAITGFHGRWETVRKAEDGKAEIICDIGHNAHGLKLVFEQLGRCAHRYEKTVVVFGVVADKDIEAMASFMVKDSENFIYIFTKSSTQRGLPAEELAVRLEPYGINGIVKSTVAEAVAAADEIAGEKDLIFVGGSNFTVADALVFLKFAL